MHKSGIIRHSILFLLIVTAISMLIYVPVTIGLADNSDFKRTMAAFGLTSVSEVKHWTAEYRYRLSEPAGAVQSFKNIFVPVTDNPAQYYSTQFIFTKIALFLNALAGKLLHRAPNIFYLVFQTAQYILLYACALFLFMKERWRDRGTADLAVKAIFAILFMDCGYLVYFNSFYGESTTLIFLLLSFVLLLYLEKNKNSYWVYGGLILSLFMFSGSKAANFPSTVVLCVPLVYYAMKYEDAKKKWIVCLSVVLMLIASFSYVMSTPKWMKKDTAFQAVFFGVLYNNPSPKQAVQELGLPRELSEYESMNAYNWHSLNPEGMKDVDFRATFVDRIGQFDILKYYLTHPAFFTAKLDMSAEAALPLRPTYLTNVHLPSSKSDLRFDDRMNLWESTRKQFSGYASLFIGLILLLSAWNVAALLRKQAGLYRILLRLALMGTAAGQFIIPIVSNGNADLQKHMFLFNVHLDLLILVLLLDNLDWRSRMFRRTALVTVALLIIIAHPPGKPKVLTMGHMNGTPIQWYVLEKKDGWVKVIAKDALYRSALDDISNDYLRSDIEERLNDTDFYQWFTPDERGRIRHAKYYAISSDNYSRRPDAGDRPLYWFSPLKYAAQNSNRAFRNSYSAYLTLPSVDDVKQLFDRSKTAAVLPADYWLSTPYYGSSDMSRIVSSDYQVYHRRVNARLGIRPVMWVRE